VDEVTMAKILCVDDTSDIRELLVDELRDAGYQTIEAANGEEGLAAILEHKPDLVLCDITMPVMNGYQLLETLRKDHPGFAEMPFIFLSGLADRKDVIAGKQLGGDDYLTKPVDFEIMRATVKARLDQVRRIDQQKQIELNELRESVLRISPPWCDGLWRR
jgi:DNA-binding response OmpR family regulator